MKNTSFHFNRLFTPLLSRQYPVESLYHKLNAISLFKKLDGQIQEKFLTRKTFPGISFYFKRNLSADNLFNTSQTLFALEVIIENKVK